MPIEQPIDVDAKIHAVSRCAGCERTAPFRRAGRPTPQPGSSSSTLRVRERLSPDPRVPSVSVRARCGSLPCSAGTSPVTTPTNTVASGSEREHASVDRRVGPRKIARAAHSGRARSPLHDAQAPPVRQRARGRRTRSRAAGRAGRARCLTRAERRSRAAALNARTSSRFATFAHAMSSTSSDTRAEQGRDASLRRELSLPRREDGRQLTARRRVGFRRRQLTGLTIGRRDLREAPPALDAWLEPRDDRQPLTRAICRPVFARRTEVPPPAVMGIHTSIGLAPGADESVRRDADDRELPLRERDRLPESRSGSPPNSRCQSPFADHRDRRTVRQDIIARHDRAPGDHRRRRGCRSTSRSRARR